jgi:hypothetical protein
LHRCAGAVPHHVVLWSDTGGGDSCARMAADPRLACLGGVNGRGLSLAHNRPRVYASFQLFSSLFTTAEATT